MLRRMRQEFQAFAIAGKNLKERAKLQARTSGSSPGEIRVVGVQAYRFDKHVHLLGCWRACVVVCPAEVRIGRLYGGLAYGEQLL
jgi:hypothetical protein